MMKYAILVLALVATVNALPSSERVRRSYALYPAPAVPVVPALAAVPTLTAVHSQRLVPQPPAIHTVASPTTVLQTVQTGHAVVGHQKVGDQIVGKTPDVNGYAFRSDVRHDAPLVAAPVYAAPLVGPAPLPVPVVAAPAPVYAPAPVFAAPAPVYAPAPASVSSYSVETGHTIAHDHIVTSPVIQQTLHAPVIGAAPIVAPVAYPAPAPVALPAYKKA